MINVVKYFATLKDLKLLKYSFSKTESLNPRKRNAAFLDLHRMVDIAREVLLIVHY